MTHIFNKNQTEYLTKIEDLRNWGFFCHRQVNLCDCFTDRSFKKIISNIYLNDFLRIRYTIVRLAFVLCPWNLHFSVTKYVTRLFLSTLAFFSTNLIWGGEVTTFLVSNSKIINSARGYPKCPKTLLSIRKKVDSALPVVSDLKLLDFQSNMLYFSDILPCSKVKSMYSYISLLATHTYSIFYSYSQFLWIEK